MTETREPEAEQTPEGTQPLTRTELIEAEYQRLRQGRCPDPCVACYAAAEEAVDLYLGGAPDA